MSARYGPFVFNRKTGGFYYVWNICQCRGRPYSRRVCAHDYCRDHIVSGGVLFRGETFRKEKDEHKAARILRGGDGAGLYYIVY